MERELLIPTSGSKQRLNLLLESILGQTEFPKIIRFLLHSSSTQENLGMIQAYIKQRLGSITNSEILIHHEENSDFQSGQGVGYDRNFLVQQATHEYLFMIDDDNVFEKTFFEDSLKEYASITKEKGVCLRSPLIERRKSGTIQSAGIKGFRWWMPKRLYAKPGSDQTITMIGANSLLGPTDVFQNSGFDEVYRSCLEDIDFSYRVSLSEVPIIVSDLVRIQHMEREKSLLEKKFLGSPESAYERSRNRILFAKKNATRWQKIQYFGLGLWAQTFWFLLLSLMWGGEQRGKLVVSVIKGTWDGLRY